MDLIISESTVKYHLRNILDKLHLENRGQVIAYATRRGLAPPGARPSTGYSPP
jgi:DNA-binding CsgD family transcriptional regulator